MGMAPLVPEWNVPAPEAGLHVVARTHAPKDIENDQLRELPPSGQAPCARLCTADARDLSDATEFHRLTFAHPSWPSDMPGRAASGHRSIQLYAAVRGASASLHLTST